MNRNDFIKPSQTIFELPLLTYNSEELEDMVRFIEDYEVNPLYQPVLKALRETAKFRYATHPEEPFRTLRAHKTDTELQNIFINLNTVLKSLGHQATQALEDKDRELLFSALIYCKKSILNQISSLPVDDPLLVLWNQSELKRF